MTKRILALMLTLFIMCGVLAACGSEKITVEKAQQIALEDMGVSANEATVHAHTAQDGSFTVFVTHNGENMTYVIGTDGQIVTKAEGGHTH